VAILGVIGNSPTRRLTIKGVKRAEKVVTLNHKENPIEPTGQGQRKRMSGLNPLNY